MIRQAAGAKMKWKKRSEERTRINLHRRVFFWIGFSVRATRHTTARLVTKHNEPNGSPGRPRISILHNARTYTYMNTPGSPRKTHIDGALDSNKQREANITCTHGQWMARRNDGLRAIIFLSLFRRVFLYFSSLPPQPRPFVVFFSPLLFLSPFYRKRTSCWVYMFSVFSASSNFQRLFSFCFFQFVSSSAYSVVAAASLALQFRS